jgi:exosortase/archaeosortase family protein
MAPFAALCCGFLVAAVPCGAISFLGRFDARAASMLLGWCGMHPSVNGVIMSLDGASIGLARECSWLLLAAPFAAFVLAVPASSVQKAAGLLAGIPALMAANVVRICAILMAGAHSHDLMVYTHSFFGQVAMVLLVLTACLAWLAVTVDSPQVRTILRFTGRTLVFAFVLSAAWFAVGGRFAQSVVTLACAGLEALGLGAFHPDMARVGPGAVNAFGLLLLCSLVLASPGTHPGRRVAALTAGCLCLTLLLVAQEMTEALVFNHTHEQTPWWLSVLAAIQQLPLPVLLWHALGGGKAMGTPRYREPARLGLYVSTPDLFSAWRKP